MRTGSETNRGQSGSGGGGPSSPADQPDDAPSVPAEVHQPHDRPSKRDAWGYDLTWGTVLSSHAALVQHASCDGGGGRPSGFDSDGSDDGVCPCQYHPALIEQLQDHRYNCHAWMLPPARPPAEATLPLCVVCAGVRAVCAGLCSSRLTMRSMCGPKMAVCAAPPAPCIDRSGLLRCVSRAVTVCLRCSS